MVSDMLVITTMVGDLMVQAVVMESSHLLVCLLTHFVTSYQTV